MSSVTQRRRGTPYIVDSSNQALVQHTDVELAAVADNDVITQRGGKWINEPKIFADSNDFAMQGDGVADDTASANLAAASGKIVHIIDGSYATTGSIDFSAGTGFAGVGNRRAFLQHSTTGLSSEFGYRLSANNIIRDLKITSICNAGSVGNSRTNGAIYAGSDNYNGDGVYSNIQLNNLNISRSGTGAAGTNVIQFFNDTSNVNVNNVNVDGEFYVGLQTHWNYSLDTTSTNHPRRISIVDMSIDDTSSNNASNHYSFSGSHDIYLRSAHSKNASQAYIITPGDVGDMRSPAAESVDRICSNMSLIATSAENTKNEGIFILGTSGRKDAGTDNTQYIAADSEVASVNILGHTNLKGADSSNNTTVFVRGYKNVYARNVNTGLRAGEQATDTSPVLVIQASVNVDIDSNSHAVVAADILSGKYIKLHVNHENSDVANSTSQNGVIIRGSVETALTSGAILAGDTSITLASIPCDIHKGMRFYHGGNEFEFRSSASYSGTASQNTNITFKIKPAAAAIASGETLELMYCADNVTISGSIYGANKGIRVVGNDSRLNQNIVIEADINNSIARAIEVVGGQTVKYKGSYYYNDAGGSFGITSNGSVTPSTVIIYNKIGYNKIGHYTSVPTAGDWIVGDIIYDKTATSSETHIGWRCIAAGSPGTWEEIVRVEA